MDPNLTNKLVKIVLQKLNTISKSLKTKDPNYAEKLAMIEELHKQFGWGEDERAMNLR